MRKHLVIVLPPRFEVDHEDLLQVDYFGEGRRVVECQSYRSLLVRCFTSALCDGAAPFICCRVTTATFVIKASCEKETHKPSGRGLRIVKRRDQSSAPHLVCTRTQKFANVGRRGGARGLTIPLCERREGDVRVPFPEVVRVQTPIRARLVDVLRMWEGTESV